MIKGFYTIENGSIYIELVRPRYRFKEYERWWVRYWLIKGMHLIDEERNRKLVPDRIKHWKAVANILMILVFSVAN